MSQALRFMGLGVISIVIFACAAVAEEVRLLSVADLGASKALDAEADAYEENGGKTGKFQHTAVARKGTWNLESGIPRGSSAKGLNGKEGVGYDNVDTNSPTGPAPNATEVKNCLNTLKQAALHATADVSGLEKKKRLLLKEAMTQIAAHEVKSAAQGQHASTNADGDMVTVASQMKAKLKVKHATTASTEDKARHQQWKAQEGPSKVAERKKSEAAYLAKRTKTTAKRCKRELQAERDKVTELTQRIKELDNELAKYKLQAEVSPGQKVNEPYTKCNALNVDKEAWTQQNCWAQCNAGAQVAGGSHLGEGKEVVKDGKFNTVEKLTEVQNKQKRVLHKYNHLIKIRKEQGLTLPNTDGSGGITKMKALAAKCSDQCAVKCNEHCACNEKADSQTLGEAGKSPKYDAERLAAEAKTTFSSAEVEEAKAEAEAQEAQEALERDAAQAASGKLRKSDYSKYGIN